MADVKHILNEDGEMDIDAMFAALEAKKAEEKEAEAADSADDAGAEKAGIAAEVSEADEEGGGTVEEAVAEEAEGGTGGEYRTEESADTAGMEGGVPTVDDMAGENAYQYAEAAAGGGDEGSLEGVQVEGDPFGGEGGEDPGLGFMPESEPQKSVKKAPKKKGRILSFSRKILLLCLAPMIIIVALLTTLSTNAIRSNLENEIEKSLEIVAASLELTFSSLYEGDYTIDKSGVVRKGERKISGDTKLLKALKEATGYEMTMYFNVWNKTSRLITTLTNDKDKFINGTKMEPEIEEKVFAGETLYLPDVEIEGNTYFAMYKPITDAEGKVIGAIGVATDYRSARAAIAKETSKILVISLLLLVVFSVLIVILASAMVKVMGRIRKFLEKLSMGNLSETVLPVNRTLMRRNDELGDIYRMSVKLQREFRDIVTNIKQSTENLTLSAEQLSAMAANTNVTVDEVCLSLDEVTKGSETQTGETNVARENVEKITEHISLIHDAIDELARNSGKMSDAELQEEDIIQQLNNSNVETIKAVERVSEQITALNKSVQSISKATGMIQDIADETELLSLNASIEAARAGEAGKGFAVVAQQINKLADQSDVSAQQIDKIIASLLEESRHMVETMKEVRGAINQQQEKLDETMEKTAAVAKGVASSLNSIDTIRKKTELLDQSSDAIVGVVTDLATISEQNQATANETMNSARDVSGTMDMLEQSAEALRSLAAELDETLSVFSLE